MSNLLTHSRIQTFKTCPKLHFYKYELGVRPKEDSRSLRFGTAMHAMLEKIGLGASREDAIAAGALVLDGGNLDAYDAAIEHETFVSLAACYFWHWSREEVPAELKPVKYIETEKVFRLPIFNPHTNKSTPIFEQAGKRDAIVQTADGATVIMEHKTTSDSIEPGSDYWKRVQIDYQISMYLAAALQEKKSVANEVLYNVIRKPTIRPYQATPPDKRKFKADGTLYANMRMADESPADWGARLRADIAERPDFYFARQRVVRLSEDLHEFEEDLWTVQQQIRQRQLEQRWPRNTAACVGFGRCPFLDHCRYGVSKSAVPPGFTVDSDVHPELKEAE